MVVAGRYSDGRSSRMQDVRLLLEDGELVATTADGARLAWPSAAVVISPRLGSTPRVLRLPDGGRIESPDDPSLDAWFQAPSRVERIADWLERRRGAIVGAALGTVVAIVLGLRFGVPWLAREVAERMPVPMEQAIGAQAASVIEKMYLSPSALPVSRRGALRDAFERMVAGEPRADRMRLEFAGSKLLGANAFALPDGRIYVTDELVALARDDREVLAVLAHEAGHHVHRHGVRQAIEQSSVFLLAGLLFGDISGSSIAVAIPATLVSNGFSRGHEREADAYAFDLLRRTGRSPADFAAIMRRLAREHGEPGDGGVVGYLSTHPPSPERIRAAEAAADPPAGPGSVD